MFPDILDDVYVKNHILLEEQLHNDTFGHILFFS